MNKQLTIRFTDNMDGTTTVETWQWFDEPMDERHVTITDASNSLHARKMHEILNRYIDDESYVVSMSAGLSTETYNIYTEGGN